MEALCWVSMCHSRTRQPGEAEPTSVSSGDPASLYRVREPGSWGHFRGMLRPFCLLGGLGSWHEPQDLKGTMGPACISLMHTKYCLNKEAVTVAVEWWDPGSGGSSLMMYPVLLPSLQVDTKGQLENMRQSLSIRQCYRAPVFGCKYAFINASVFHLYNSCWCDFL